MFRPWREFGAVDRTGGKIAVGAFERTSARASRPKRTFREWRECCRAPPGTSDARYSDATNRGCFEWTVRWACYSYSAPRAAVRSGAHALQPHVECECDETGQQMPQQRGKSPQVTRRGIRAATPLSQRRAGIASAHPRATFERSSRSAEGGEGPPSRKSTCFCICLIRSCDSSSAG